VVSIQEEHGADVAALLKGEELLVVAAAAAAVKRSVVVLVLDSRTEWPQQEVETMVSPLAALFSIVTLEIVFRLDLLYVHL
jgi:hypothetical protein